MRPIATPHPTSASRGTAAVAECFSAQTIFEPLGATRASLIPSPGRSGWQQGARPGRSARRCPDLGSCESARPYDEAFPRQAASRPFSSHRRARLLAPILGIIASSRVCALCRSSTVRKPAFVKARALASVNPLRCHASFRRGPCRRGPKRYRSRSTGVLPSLCASKSGLTIQKSCAGARM
jgi:hypothetical protein